MFITRKLGAAGLSGLLLTLALAPAALAVSAGVVSYHGKTSQSGLFELGVTHPKNGKVKFVRLQWAAKCKSHLKSIVSTTGFIPQPNKISNGSFSGKAHFTAPIGGTNGDEGHFRVSAAGHTTSTKATGTFTGHAVIYKGSTKVTTCSSGQVTWSATRT
jgi:hypothetical protein